MQHIDLVTILEAILTSTRNRVINYFVTRLPTPQDGFQNHDKVYFSIELKHIAVPEFRTATFLLLHVHPVINFR